MSTRVTPTPDGVVFCDIYSSEEYRLSASGDWAMRDDYDWVSVTAEEVPDKILRVAALRGDGPKQAGADK